MTLFTAEDIEQFSARGIDATDAARQIDLLRNPPVPIVLDRPCTVGDGITRIPDHDRAALTAMAEAAAAAGRVTKFVPASGAATRMFKDLIAARSAARPSESGAGRQFFDSLDSFAFAEELRRTAGVAVAASAQHERAILDALLETMAYVRKPKGLVAFHRAGKVRTAFEEHLLEGTTYARAADGTSKMHFTVAPEFRAEFESTLERLREEIEGARSARLAVEFSEQHPSTDTLAIDENGDPFRTSDGALLFRPGGHGALLHNLAEMHADIAVIKNIDNILPDEKNDEVVQWKRLLIGSLVRMQSEIAQLLEACEREENGALDAAIDYAATRFDRRPRSTDDRADEKRQFVFEALDRPLRVVGVVRNEGEPGGAPFWVVDRNGSRSVQIVESAQVNVKDDAQARIFASSTHFNPVDIICSLRSWRGEPFDLARFVDPDAVFLSQKSHEGRPLTALERPGLWNGAMAFWNSVCVEVPGSTFAPVKTVFDLLRKQHQIGQ